MALTGIDPNDPIPETRRELIFGAGPGGTAPERNVLIYGNKTSAGSETVDVLSDSPITGDDDAKTRFGARSEWYRMYRSYVEIDPLATIYGIAVTESAGSAANCKLRVHTTSDAVSTVTVTILGIAIPYTVEIGDTVQTTAEGIADAINNADDGRLPVTATAGVNGSDWDVTVTAANKGPRGDFIIGDTAKRGVRVSMKTSGAANAQTVTKKAFTAGTTADDGTAAITAAGNALNYYHVSPWHTDNGAGSTATYVSGGAGNITFADADPDTITRVNGSWVTDGFEPGMSITIGSSVSNNGTYLINAVSALVITLDPNEELTGESLAEGTLTATGKYGLGGTTTVSSTDNQVGELVTMIKDQAMPAGGKEQCAIFGLVGTNAQAIAVPTDADINTVRAFFFWQEDSDWTPAMLAAHHAAVMRSQQIAHPSANMAGYSSSDQTPYKVPGPFDVNDRPTTTEIRTALNNGVSVIGTSAKNRTSIVRQITARSENSSGDKDYRAREGHITSAIDFAWGVVKDRWESQKQPFVADNPGDGEVPTARTTTPGFVEAMVKGVIDDLTSSKPLGIYDGPILAPDQRDKMKASVTATKIAAGISVVAEFIAVQHLLKFEGTFLETGEAY